LDVPREPHCGIDSMRDDSLLKLYSEPRWSLLMFFQIPGWM
jgi:hypothetical protein